MATVAVTHSLMKPGQDIHEEGRKVSLFKTNLFPQAGDSLFGSTMTKDMRSSLCSCKVHQGQLSAVLNALCFEIL